MSLPITSSLPPLWLPAEKLPRLLSQWLLTALEESGSQTWGDCRPPSHCLSLCFSLSFSPHSPALLHGHTQHTGWTSHFYQGQKKPICKTTNDEAKVRNRDELTGNTRDKESPQLLIPFPSPDESLVAFSTCEVFLTINSSLLLKSVKVVWGFVLFSLWSK